MNENERFNRIMEEMRIKDLKIDIDTVLAEIVKHIKGSCVLGEECARCRINKLYHDLKWFKSIL